MRVDKTVIVPEKTTEQLDYVECDLCKKRFDDDDWGASFHEIRETEVSLRTGVGYSDGGNSTEYSFDVCPDCFTAVLIPFFQSKGANPTVAERMF